MNQAAKDIRHWLHTTHAATLCTLTAKPDLAGFPHGSIVPFAVDGDGRPFILIARIAAHTANLRRDNRATLFVHDPHAVGDPQASWRVGVTGRFAPVEDPAEAQRLHVRYLARVPQADGYLDTHDFAYWRMEEVLKARYIAGFGRICWVDGVRILRDPLGGGLAEAAPGAIEHMNEDHAHNMIEMCQGLRGYTPQTARMTSLDCSGFTVETESRTEFFAFPEEITAASLRTAVIQVLHQARK